MVKSSFRLLLAGLTVFLAWFEFREKLFESEIFLMILIGWFVYAVIFFVNDWINAREDTVEDKLDKLINEIRQDRNEHNKPE